MAISRSVRVFAVVSLVFTAVVWVLAGDPFPDGRPLEQNQIRFLIDQRVLVGRPGLRTLRAEKRGKKQASGQFFWDSQNGSGIWVEVNPEKRMIYGVEFASTPESRYFAYHVLGTIDEAGRLVFLPGARFTYTPQGFDMGDVVAIRLPTETQVAFTVPLPIVAQ